MRYQVKPSVRIDSDEL